MSLIVLVIILVLLGILLFLVEIFLIPGLSVAGIAGIVSFGVSIYVSYADIGAMAGHCTLLCSVLSLSLTIYIFLKYKTLDKIALKSNSASKVDLVSDINMQVGDIGISISRLAPMGKIKINNKVVEAKTTVGFIDEETPIVVVEVQGNTAVVEIVKNNDK